MLQKFILTSLLFTSFVSTANVFASENHWEFGLGIGSQLLADYRGSSHYQVNNLPFPYVVHHSKYLKIDRDGVKSKLVETPRFELDISVDAALSGDSEDNELRKGMPEIHSSFELGPSFNINLTGEDFQSGWSLRLPIRQVVAFDFESFEPIGYVFNPKLTWRKPRIWNDWNFKTDLGFLYGSSEYHDYYYSILPEYETPERLSYVADKGYSGHYFKLSLKRKGQQWFMGAYLRYDNLSDAVFRDSALVEDRHYFALGLAVARSFWVY